MVSLRRLDECYVNRGLQNLRSQSSTSRIELNRLLMLKEMIHTQCVNLFATRLTPTAAIAATQYSEESGLHAGRAPR
jgi:hypothetical protein